MIGLRPDGDDGEGGCVWAMANGAQKLAAKATAENNERRMVCMFTSQLKRAAALLGLR